MQVSTTCDSLEQIVLIHMDADQCMYVNKHSGWDLAVTRMAHKGVAFIQASTRLLIDSFLQPLLVQLQPVDLDIITFGFWLCSPAFNQDTQA